MLSYIREITHGGFMMIMYIYDYVHQSNLPSLVTGSVLTVSSTCKPYKTIVCVLLEVHVVVTRQSCVLPTLTLGTI